MGKKIKIVLAIFAVFQFILGMMIVIGIIFVLDGVGIIELGGDNSANSSIDGTITDVDVKKLLTMSDSEVWAGLTGGYLSAKPDSKNPANAKEINDAVSKKVEKIKIKVHTWKDPSDSHNMEIVTKEEEIEVNALLTKLWKAFFNDIYIKDPKFVIVQVGCLSDRSGTTCMQSRHPYGAAVDINGDTGENMQYVQPISKESWQKLPENHKKYQIIYKDSTIVKIAHKYTLSWGGEWNSSKDNMHFSFIGDYSRAQLIKKYGN